MTSRNKGIGGSTFTANQRRPSFVALLEKRIIALEETISLIADWVKFDKTKLSHTSSFKEWPNRDSVNSVVKSVARQTKTKDKMVNISPASSPEDSDSSNDNFLDDEAVDLDHSDPEDDDDDDGEGKVDSRESESSVVELGEITDSCVNLNRQEVDEGESIQDSNVKNRRRQYTRADAEEKQGKACSSVVVPQVQTILKCEICDQCFTSRKNLRQHKVKDHNASKDYHCPHCEKKFKHHCNLLIHVRIHTGERPFLCNTCGKSWARSWGLAEHIKTCHSDTPQPVTWYMCKYCGYKCKTQSNCKSHESRHEGKSEKTCPYCNLEVTNLKGHIDNVHLKIRKYPCPHCDHSFKRPGHLKRHVATHSNPNRRNKGYHIDRPDKPKNVGTKTVLRMNTDPAYGEKSEHVNTVNELEETKHTPGD